MAHRPTAGMMKVSSMLQFALEATSNAARSVFFAMCISSGSGIGRLRRFAVVRPSTAADIAGRCTLAIPP